MTERERLQIPLTPPVRSVDLDARVGWAVLLAALVMTGCYASHRRPGPSGGDAGPGVDAAPRVDADCIEVIPEDGGLIRPEQVDLLVMVDNSNSMSEEQASLIRELPRLVRGLSSGDIDGDGVEEFTPVGSLRVGVVTSDMGTGGFAVPTCDRADFGDDGVMQTRGRVTVPGCERTFPPFLLFEPSRLIGGTPDAFAGNAACLMRAGTGGCGFEQQLEAVLKAVTPSTSPIRFARATLGHGDTVNADFVRPDSVLVVLLVTDENDCSARDPSLFDPFSPEYAATDLNLRCSQHSEALHPTTRYVEGLLDLRAADPGRLVFATITGIPVDLAGEPAERILEDDRTQERVDPSRPQSLYPSCQSPGSGAAFPPRRIVDVGGGLTRRGARSIHLSICQDSYAPAVALILAEVGRATRPRCR